MSTPLDSPAFARLHADFARFLRAEAAGEVRYGPFLPEEPAGLAVAHRFAFYMGVGHGNVAETDAFTHWFDRLEDPRAYILSWREAYQQLSLDQREERLAFLAPYIGRWVRFERISPSVKLLGTVALCLVIQEGLYQDFINLFQRMSGLQLPSSFKGPTDFVAAIRQACGWGSIDPSRINHDLKAAGFWLEIEAAGLPVPPNLSRIENLAYEPDGLEIYRRLVAEAGNAVPTHTAIDTFLKVRSGRTPEATGLGLRLEMTRGIQQAIQHLKEPTPDVASALKVLGTLEGRVTPQPRARRKKQPRPEAPPYDARLGCPFVLKEDGGDHLRLVLTQPIPDKVQRKLWMKACRDGWEALDAGPGTAARTWRIPLCAANPSQAHAERPAVQAFLAKLCLQMKAPLPILPNRIAPPSLP